jgi:hypothetical protein
VLLLLAYAVTLAGLGARLIAHQDLTWGDQGSKEIHMQRRGLVAPADDSP